MVGTASRCCRNTWKGNLNQSWSQVTWSSGPSTVGLLKNRLLPVSCKSDWFWSPSQKDFPFNPVVRSLSAGCLEYALEIWLGKTPDAAGKLSQWATITEPVCPSICDVQHEKTLEWNTQAQQLQGSSCSLLIEKTWAVKTECSQNFFF